MTSEPAPPDAVYRSSPRTRRILVGVWAACLILPGFLVLAGLATGDGSALVAGLAVAALMSAIMLPIFWLAAWRYPRLTLGDATVAVHQLGMGLETSWDNVAGLRTEGPLALVLTEPMGSTGAGRQAAFGGTRIYGQPLYDAETERLIAEHRYMPIDVFAYWLTHGDLAYQLGHRAPQLLPDLNTLAATMSERGGRKSFLADASGQPLARRSWIAIGSLLVLGLALALLLETGSATTQSAITLALETVMATCLTVYAIANYLAAAHCFRERQVFPGLLWGTLALMLTLVVLALVGSLLGGTPAMG